MDRIDIHLEVGSVPYQELAASQHGLTSREMREQVRSARTQQMERFQDCATRYNGQMNSRQIREHCQLDREGRERIRASVQELGLSARAHDKVLRVARTIADLQAISKIRADHINEAVNYRLLDRDLWT